MEIMLKSNIVKETLKAKNYDIDEVETGKVTVGDSKQTTRETSR